ncbi:oligosaccharide flippase family protein [Mesorhizobium sp. M0898]|uniref:lipopolysaccharide biosynthesis protein n=1 Tax=Mesorhizobium sp. M0898 TaxID=2957020 RepID=UPI0033364849
MITASPPGRWIGFIFGSLTASFVVFGAGLVSGIIAARALGPEGRGILAVVLTLGNTLVSLVQIPISDAVILQKGSSPSGGSAVERASVVMARNLSLILAPVCATVMFFIMSSYGGIPTIPAVMFVAAMTALGIIGDVYRGILRSRGEFYLLQIFFVMQPLIYCLLCGVLAMYKAPVSYFIVAQTGSIIIVFLVRGGIVRVPKSGVEHWPIIKKLFEIALPVHGIGIVRMFTAQADRLAVVWLSQSEVVGLYSVAVTVSSLFVGMFSTAIRSVTLPALVQRKEPELARVIIRMLRLTWVASLAGGLLTCVVCPILVPVLFGKEFSSSSNMIYLLSLSVVLNSARDILCEVCKIYGMNRIVLAGNLVFLGAFCPMSVGLFNVVGVYGIIIAGTFSNFASTVYISKKVEKLVPAVSIKTWIFPTSATVKDLVLMVRNFAFRR